MATLIQLGLKTKDGYKNVTISINDEPNQYGQNVSAWYEQTKEERGQQVPRKFIGNGKVIWTDGKIIKPDFKNEVDLDLD